MLRGALGGECLHLRPPPRAGQSPSAAHPSDGGDEPGPAIPACSPTALGAPAGAQDSEWGGSGAAGPCNLGRAGLSPRRTEGCRGCSKATASCLLLPLGANSWEAAERIKGNKARVGGVGVPSKEPRSCQRLRPRHSHGGGTRRGDVVLAPHSPCPAGKGKKRRGDRAEPNPRERLFFWRWICLEHLYLGCSPQGKLLSCCPCSPSSSSL